MFAFCVYLFSVNTGEFGRKRRGNDAPIGETCRADHGSAGGFDYSPLENIKTPVGKQAVRGSNKRAKTVRNPAPERKRVLHGFCVSAEAKKRAHAAGCIVSNPGADKHPNSLTRACLSQSPLSRPHLLRKHKRHIFPDRLRRSSSARHIGAAFHLRQGAS